MPVKKEIDKLAQEEARLKDMWGSILSYLRKDLGLVWTEEAKQRFEELKTELYQIKLILNKDKEKYSSKLKAIADIESRLSRIKPTIRWVRAINDNIKKILEREEIKKTSKTIGRRGFLGMLAKAAAGAIAASSLPSRARAEERNFRVTVYAVRPHRVTDIDYCRKNYDKLLSKYTDGAYNLVKEFYREKLGVELNFVYCKSESEVPKDLDRRNNAIFIERQYKGVSGMDKSINEMRRAHSEGKSEKLMKKLWSNVKLDGMREGGRIDRKNNNVCVKYVGDEWKKLFGLEIDIEHAKLQLEEVRYQKFPESIKFWEESLKRYEDELKYNSELLSDKMSAHLIAHELGHLFGLVHSFQYLDDDVEDYHGKIPNVMSYEKTNMDPESKFGFGATDSQKKIVMSFVAGSEIYNLMDEAGWDFIEYCRLFEKKRGYKEFGRAPSSGLPF